jgi:hypothetical protein
MRSSLNGTPFRSTSSNESWEACTNDVELPLLPTGHEQDTGIVDLCMNSSCVTYCKSGSLWITIFVRSCSSLLLLLFVRNIFIVMQWNLNYFCPVGSNGSSTSFVHASHDSLELVLRNGVPFNDDRIFQFLQGVEGMMILSNLSVYLLNPCYASWDIGQGNLYV